jgi:hypothetical protein
MEKEIKDYLKANLSIMIDQDYYERTIRVKLFLDGEEISSSFTPIDSILDG